MSEITKKREEEVTVEVCDQCGKETEYNSERCNGCKRDFCYECKDKSCPRIDFTDLMDEHLCIGCTNKVHKELEALRKLESKYRTIRDKRRKLYSEIHDKLGILY